MVGYDGSANVGEVVGEEMMEPVIGWDGVRVFSGDCREVLRGLPDNSVDSVVTDPPYELGFMGKKWDSSGIAYDVTVWKECLRVLKPGGHLLAFGGSRTWHRLAVAVEDAGFEIRDNIAWIYGSGFPKSLDVSKAIDKAAGAERRVLGTRKKVISTASWGIADGGFNDPRKAGPDGVREFDITAPATSEAQQWEGWGTALKPAHEPIVVGRKPLIGTVAENVLEWGVGGLNIDGSRIGSEKRTFIPRLTANENLNDDGWSKIGEQSEATTVEGRWPANVIFDEVTAGLLDEQSGVSVSKPTQSGGYLGNSLAIGGSRVKAHGSKHNDSGGASRFFYVAKASKRDRNEGLEELDAQRHADRVTDDGVGGDNPRNRTNQAKQNFHPTVKPTQLMRYLVKLVTPPGGTVLDPFTGSGSTGKAAILEGFDFVGVELTEDYLPIIEGRLKWARDNADDGTLF
jgi:DNA modification methylase